MGQTLSHADPSAGHSLLVALTSQEKQLGRYLIAGIPVLVDLRTDLLEPFAVVAPAGSRTASPSGDLMGIKRAILAQGKDELDMTVWICKAQRKLQARRLHNDLLIKIEGLGEFVVRPDQSIAARVNDGAQLTTDEALEVVLGPLLTPLLAYQGVFCLHASALHGVDGAICLVGESGSGKSTLAAYLGEELKNTGRLADDVMPVRLGKILTALPGYPQLKIPAVEQTGRTTQSMPLTTVIEVRAAAPGEAELALSPCSRAEGSLILARHTVAARLFGPQLLASHFEFCAAASRYVTSYVLTYPHKAENLSRVLDLLKTEFGWR